MMVDGKPKNVQQPGNQFDIMSLLETWKKKKMGYKQPVMEPDTQPSTDTVQSNLLRNANLEPFRKLLSQNKDILGRG
jgi:hypothetical protein